MMEIVYGPVVLGCLAQSLAFGLLFALAFPAILARMAPSALAMSPASRLGLGLVAGGNFGMAHLALVCAADGFPPRIVQSTAGVLLVTVLIGFLVLKRARGREAAIKA